MSVCRCGHDRAAHEWAWCEGVCFPPGDPGSCDCEAFVDAGRAVLLVHGGTPLAEVIARALDDPEQRERMVAAYADLGRQVAAWFESLRPALAELGRQVTALVDDLREAGVLDEQPPTDPRARALWQRQHRNTGPARPGPEQRHPPRRLR